MRSKGHTASSRFGLSNEFLGNIANELGEIEFGLRNGLTEMKRWKLIDLKSGELKVFLDPFEGLHQGSNRSRIDGIPEASRTLDEGVLEGE